MTAGLLGTFTDGIPGGSLESATVQLAAVVPHPPLLVPALAAGRAAEVATLLAACDAAVTELVTQAPPVVVCVGGGTRTTRHLRNAWGTFAGYGADVRAGPSPGVEAAAVPRLPLSLTAGRWLLDRAGWLGEVVCQEVATTAPAADCWATGRRLLAEVEDEYGPGSAWLVLGDGDDGAALRAFEAGEPELLADVPDGVEGRAAWQALAGAVTARPVGGKPRPERVRYDAAPFGVHYLVAGWWLAG